MRPVLLLLALSLGCARPEARPQDTSTSTEDAPDDDRDGDGFTPREGDCDDDDAAVHIAAEDVPGDGIDSNCDLADVRSRWAGLADLRTEPAGFSAGAMGTELVVGPVAPGGRPDVFVGVPGPTGSEGYGVLLRYDARLELVAAWNDPALSAFGRSLSLVPDLTGDGVGDLLTTNWIGQAFVLSADAQTAPDEYLNALVVASTLIDRKDTQRPHFVGPGPDRDGDGLPDLLVSVWGPSHVEEDSFLAVLPSPLPDLATVRDLTRLATGTFGPFRLVDLDGDGHDELVAYENAHDVLTLLDGADPSQRRHVFSAEVSLSPLAAGDLDGDGVDELVVGGSTHDVPGVGERAGRAVVVNDIPEGPTSDLVDLPLQVQGLGPYDWMGRSAAIGDFNGDGQADLAVSASGDVYFASVPGRVHVWLGPLTGPLRVEDAWFSAHGEAPGDDFGAALAAADLDGDGLDDLLVGAPQWAGEGRVYVFHAASMAP